MEVNQGPFGVRIDKISLHGIQSKGGSRLIAIN